MDTITIEKFFLVGLALKKKTTNANGQSAIDCGSLWQQFEKGNYKERIAGKTDNEIIAVYHSYEGDHTKPFSYFIGCRVEEGAKAPEGMDMLTIEKGIYKKIMAHGKMPDCIANAWKKVWLSGIDRAYTADFEVYGDLSKNWNDATVELYIAVK